MLALADAAVAQPRPEEGALTLSRLIKQLSESVAALDDGTGAADGFGEKLAAIHQAFKAELK